MSTIRTNAILDASGGNTATINGITPALSSQAQAEAGTDNTTQLTPLRLRNALNATGSAPVYACRAWVNFNGTGTVAIRASGNVSSITDNGTGKYRVNFATAMPDANYSVQCSAGRDSYSIPNVAGEDMLGTKSASVVDIGVHPGNGALVDSSSVSVAIFR